MKKTRIDPLHKQIRNKRRLYLVKRIHQANRAKIKLRNKQIKNKRRLYLVKQMHQREMNSPSESKKYFEIIMFVCLVIGGILGMILIPLQQGKDIMKKEQTRLQKSEIRKGE